MVEQHREYCKTANIASFEGNENQVGKRGPGLSWNNEDQITVIPKTTDEEYYTNKICTDQYTVRKIGKEVILTKKRL